MNTKNIGDISEAFIAAELLGLGLAVLKPLGDNQRYDLLIDKDGVFYRVQCKTANTTDRGSVTFPVCSTYAHRGGKRKNYLGQAEYVMAYDHKTKEVFWEEINEDTPQVSRTLSRGSLRNIACIKAEDRLIDKFPLIN